MKINAKNVRKAKHHLGWLRHESAIDDVFTFAKAEAIQDRLQFLEQFIDAVDAKGKERGREEENE